MAEETARRIAPADGKLGVLCVGLGAVATTFIAGVENVRRGAARPIGSLTQMGTIRLGKRTEGRAPLIRDFVPLASLTDLVFGAWDPVPDDAYTAAVKAGVLDRHEHVDRMTLWCEVDARPDGLAEAIATTLTSITGLRGEIAFAAPGELANDGKVIDDRRAHD